MAGDMDRETRLNLCHKLMANAEWWQGKVNDDHLTLVIAFLKERMVVARPSDSSSVGAMTPLPKGVPPLYVVPLMSHDQYVGRGEWRQYLHSDSSACFVGPASLLVLSSLIDRSLVSLALVFLHEADHAYGWFVLGNNGERNGQARLDEEIRVRRNDNRAMTKFGFNPYNRYIDLLALKVKEEIETKDEMWIERCMCSDWRVLDGFLGSSVSGSEQRFRQSKIAHHVIEVVASLLQPDEAQRPVLHRELLLCFYAKAAPPPMLKRYAD
ncbi:hypothetical protein KW782_00765 [Candidatus Parcubacteria bacterium]|nr:hypothetical protein [Candidatus Parcubacteria bacterium]